MVQSLKPKKKLFETELVGLAIADVEGLGVVQEDYLGNTFRWIKNSSTTDLVAKGCCLMKLGVVADDTFKRVLSPNAIATGPATALITMPAGVPMTAIAKSGGGTGDHGWILVNGAIKVSMRQGATAVDQEAGCRAIATTICVTNSEWGKAITSVISSTVGGVNNARGVQVMASLITTGVATVASAIVNVRCL